MLSSAGLNAQSHRFPSWVSDWTTARAECLHESDQRATPFVASGSYEPSISKSSAETDKLLVGGFEVDRVQRIAVGWRLISTEKGYIGVAQGMVELGDVVAILKGGLVPFILRGEPTLGKTRGVPPCWGGLCSRNDAWGGNFASGGRREGAQNMLMDWAARCGFASVVVIWHPFGRLLGSGGRKVGQRELFLEQGWPIRLMLWTCVGTSADSAYVAVVG